MAKRPWVFLADAVLVYSFAAYGGSACVGSVHFFLFFFSFFFILQVHTYECSLGALICAFLLGFFVCVFLLICPHTGLGGFSFRGEPKLNCSIIFRVGFCTQTSGDRVLSDCVWCLMFDVNVCCQIFQAFFFFFFGKVLTCCFKQVSPSLYPHLKTKQQKNKNSSFTLTVISACEWSASYGKMIEVLVFGGGGGALGANLSADLSSLQSSVTRLVNHAREVMVKLLRSLQQ